MFITSDFTNGSIIQLPTGDFACGQLKIIDKAAANNICKGQHVTATCSVAAEAIEFAMSKYCTLQWLTQQPRSGEVVRFHTLPASHAGRIVSMETTEFSARDLGIDELASITSMPALIPIPDS